MILYIYIHTHNILLILYDYLSRTDVIFTIDIDIIFIKYKLYFNIYLIKNFSFKKYEIIDKVVKKIGN